jgi:polyisoprenyl-phosphate glycosyltransferase
VSVASRDGSSCRLSVVVPVYNEEEAVPLFLARTEKVLAGLGNDWEILFALDPCLDGTERVVLEHRAREPRIKLLKMSRRFGQPAATLAGLHWATGDACVVIDVDLQDPPELIPELVTRFREGFDVVYARRLSRKGEPILRRVVAAIAYRVINRISAVPIPRDTGDFRLLSRRVVDELKKLREGHGYLRGLVGLLGYRQTAVPYHRDERMAGRTKYPLTGSLRIGLNGLLGFSRVPLQMVSAFGGLLVAAGFLTLVLSIFGPGLGWAWRVSGLVPLVLLLSGFQSLALGILGEYVGRIYDEVRARPLFLVESAHGFSRQDTA